jgi:hypothetical protein
MPPAVFDKNLDPRDPNYQIGAMFCRQFCALPHFVGSL